MIEVKGDFWKEALNADALVCTINGVVMSNGRLVMGAGIAKQFRDKYSPNLDLAWGQQRLGQPEGLLISKLATQCFELKDCEMTLIGLPTKTDWKKPSDINFVAHNLQLLLEYVNVNDFKKVVMTRPGCGHGGLQWSQVKPLMQEFNDNVFVIERV